MFALVLCTLKIRWRTRAIVCCLRVRRRWWRHIRHCIGFHATCKVCAQLCDIYTTSVYEWDCVLYNKFLSPFNTKRWFFPCGNEKYTHKYHQHRHTHTHTKTPNASLARPHRATNAFISLRFFVLSSGGIRSARKSVRRHFYHSQRFICFRHLCWCRSAVWQTQTERQQKKRRRKRHI